MAFTLCTVLTSVAPANEEVGIDPHVGLAVLGAGVGAVTIGAASGGAVFLYYSDACAAEGCRDNPAYIAAPVAGAFGVIFGGVIGAVLGSLLADALGVKPVVAPAIGAPGEPVPDE